MSTLPLGRFPSPIRLSAVHSVPPRPPSLDALLGRSPASLELARLVPKLALSSASVLLEGETGVGKTFAARLLHEAGPHASEPLRVLNCAAIPEALLESELFGCERGAFTGALVGRIGALEAAGRGTVLLDEIGELSLASQAKLLGVLEERSFERLGSNRGIELNARVLFATNRDLEAMVRAGTFRQDLWFRVSVVRVRVPSLRERAEDVEAIARRVLDGLCEREGRARVEIAEDALQAIRQYSWPGNVRELRNALERAMALGDGECVRAEDLPLAAQGVGASCDAEDELRGDRPYDLGSIEQRAIRAALRAAGGNRTRAAEMLGISRATLYKKIGRDGGIARSVSASFFNPNGGSSVSP